MTRIRLLLPFWMNDANVDAVAQHRGWPFVEARPATEAAREAIWMTADQQTFINYVADFGLQLHYVVVQGQEAEEVAGELEREFPVIGREAVLGMVAAADTRDTLIHAIYHIAAAAREDREDPELFAAIERLFAHPEADVRRAAVFACTYAAWPSFREPLRRLAEQDADADVRAIAQATLDSLTSHAWQGG
ncbi:hypothetical protein [Longimicrobium sp.]|jgi:hypothetical protein|uniref:hypothetical protein n=1 Tax=Longimicrobium sp. TaxID=2029185 RepID=UPI002EDA6278